MFFGHYWLKGKPQLLCRNVGCLDYSVAAGGCLVCYRFDGEQQLDATKFVWENADAPIGKITFVRWGNWFVGACAGTDR